MVERLLLDRVDAEARGAPVGREHHRVALARAHEAGAALALVQAAFARAEVALDAAVVHAVPPAARMAPAEVVGLARASRVLLHRVAPEPELRMPEAWRQSGLAAAGARGTRSDRAAPPRPAAGRSPWTRRTAGRRRRRSGRSCAAAAASSAASKATRGESTETSIASGGRSAAVTGGKRGSR